MNYTKTRLTAIFFEFLQGIHVELLGSRDYSRLFFCGISVNKF